MSDGREILRPSLAFCALRASATHPRLEWTPRLRTDDVHSERSMRPVRRPIGVRFQHHGYLHP